MTHLSLDDDRKEKLDEWADENDLNRTEAVELMIDILTGDASMVVTDVDGVKDAVETSSGSSSSSSTTNTAEDEELQEIIDRAEDGDPIDPDEYDVSKIKGKHNIDRKAVLRSVLQSSDATQWTQDDLLNIIKTELDYSTNAARDLRNDITDEMLQSPVAGFDAPDMVDEDIEHNEDVLKSANIRPNEYRRKYGQSMDDYANSDSVNLLLDYYYLDSDGSADMHHRMLQTMIARFKYKVSGTEKHRLGHVLVDIVHKLSDNVLDAELNDYDGTLRDFCEQEQSEADLPFGL